MTVEPSRVPRSGFSWVGVSETGGPGKPLVPTTAHDHTGEAGTQQSLTQAGLRAHFQEQSKGDAGVTQAREGRVSPQGAATLRTRLEGRSPSA